MIIPVPGKSYRISCVNDKSKSEHLPEGVYRIKRIFIEKETGRILFEIYQDWQVYPVVEYHFIEA